MLRLRHWVALAAVLAPTALSAHSGHEHSEPPGWTFDPLVTVPLALLLILFLVGQRRLATRSSVERRQGWLFVVGWLVLAGALVSPLHEGGESSFTLHMIEHEAIMLGATLLIAAAHAGGILAWGLPRAWRKQLSSGWTAPFAALWRWMTEPVTATIVQAVIMWAWHAPALFNRALESQPWHVAQHVSFIFASLAFWTAMLARGRTSHWLAAACLFLTSLVEGALGALMALSVSPWYAAYAAMGVSGIGLDPTTDQQLAGLVMWIPGGLVHGAAALLLLHRWLSRAGSGEAVPAR